MRSVTPGCRPLQLKLKPHATEGTFDYVEGRMTIESPKIAAGATLVKMPVIVVSIPTARYDGDALKARDDAGDLALTIKDEPPTSTSTERRWLASRATQGNVVLTFRAPPRVITPTTRNGPLFDLRANGGGMTAAGITFIPIPDTSFPYRVSLIRCNGCRRDADSGEEQFRAVLQAGEDRRRARHRVQVGARGRHRGLGVQALG